VSEPVSDNAKLVDDIKRAADIDETSTPDSEMFEEPAIVIFPSIAGTSKPLSKPDRFPFTLEPDPLPCDPASNRDIYY
jgi:hypothetical protein